MRGLFATILWVFILVAGTGKLAYAQPVIPDFWDDRQRLTRPDLTSVTRLRFLTTTDFFPFNFRDETGYLSGFHVDLARAICRELGILERCQIQALPFDELEAALERGDGEALIAGLAITRERRERLLFSRPYLQLPARFVARQAETPEGPMHRSIAGRRVGVLDGTAHEQMLRDLFPEAQTVAYSDQNKLLEDLAEGNIYAVFGDGMRLGFWLSGEQGRACCAFAGGPYLAPEYLGHGLAIAVRSNEPALAAAMDYALQQVEASGSFTEFYLRYFPISFY